MSLIEGRYDYPKPETLPKPDKNSIRPFVALSDLKPLTYVDTIARVSTYRVVERQDQLGIKTVFTGLLEDKTFRVPFISHKTSLPMESNIVFKIISAYVHEFQDKSLLLVFTEYTKVTPQQIEDIRDYIWQPKIAHINRPVWNITLQGIVSTIYSNSGLIKRCNKCKKLIFDSCPNGCGEGWSWDVRISSRIYDGSGSIKMILSRSLVAKILGRSLGEILFLANAPNSRTMKDFDFITYCLDLPDRFNVVEAVVENASGLRGKDKLMVTDGFTLAYFPSNDDAPRNSTETSIKQLDPKNSREYKIIRKLVEKALDISIRRITGKPLLHGIYLLEEPIPLYGCEQAKLYLGFTLKIVLQDGKAIVEASPQALVRESVWDYVRWRRSKGASAKAIAKTLQTYRSNVILSPFGHIGHIDSIIFKKAGEQQVSEKDERNLVDFWRDIYGIEVSSEEIPLLRVKLVNSEQLFTYPPSTVYFDKNLLFITANTQRFVEFKKSSLKNRVRDIVIKVLQNISIGGQDLSFISEIDKGVDAQRLILNEIQQKLLGREVKAQGQVVQLGDQLCFFPQQVLQVS
ncbi:MAG: hypothetical protein H3Z54_06910 [archaeon]|nr:hypothetical protein [archaeon]